MLCCLGKFEMGIYRPNPIMLAGRAAPDLLKLSHSHSFLPALTSSFIYLQPFLAQSVHQLLSKQPFQQTIKLLHCCRLHFFFFFKGTVKIHPGISIFSIFNLFFATTVNITEKKRRLSSSLLKIHRLKLQLSAY